MRKKWSGRAPVGAHEESLAAKRVRAARMRSGAACARGAAVCLVLGSLAVLNACTSSAPLRYYTLSEVPPASEAAGATSAAAAIRIGRVRIPGELDRNEIVQRIDATRLKIAEQDRWAAPLDDMIRRVLSADLQARGATASAVAAAPAPSSASAEATSSATATPRETTAAGLATLSLDVEEFIGDASCAITLRAGWELRSAASNAAPTRSGHESIRVPPPSGACTVGALPMAMSQALAQLSERISAASR